MKCIMMILAVAGLMAAGAAGVTAAEATLYQQYEAMVAGADYVLSMQFPSGGWGWRADYAAPSTATIGATGVGMLRAYDLTGNTVYLDSAKAAGNFRIDNKYDNGDARFATFDPYFMWQLSLRAGDNTWSDYAAAGFFGELAAGTYGPDDDWDTAEYISLIQGVRAETGSSVNLRSWEFSTLGVTAAQIGQAGQAALFEAAILDGLNTLDAAKSNDSLGVAGAVRGLALMGTESFAAINSPNHAGINGIATLPDLTDYLVSQQDPAGHWWDGSAPTYMEPNSDENSQTTAYAILALMALDEEAYASSVQAGRSFLVSMQDASGAFWSYPGQTTAFNVEIAGEAVAALGGSPVPEPAGLGLMGLALLAVRKKRN